MFQSTNLSGRLLSTSGEESDVDRLLLIGAVVCGIYSVIQLLVNGIVIDEVVVPAQIISGAVPYPPGHPHQIFYPRLFNISNYLAAALWAIMPDALFLSAVRNFLFLFSSTFVPFAVAALLTRQLLWAHLAVALTVTETVLHLMGIYPIWVFPNGYSHGQLGLQAACLTVVLLLARFWRLGGFLLGVLPALHGAMAAVVWPWSICYLVLSSGRPRGRDRLRMFAAIVAGLIICVVLSLVVLVQGRNTVVRPPYDVRADGELIHRNFTSMTDVHRRLFPFPSIAYLVNPLGFFALGGLLWWDSHRPQGQYAGVLRHNTLPWLLLFGGIAWVWVYGAGIIQALTGSLPGYLQQLMPYRFSNVSALLLLPFTTAAIAAAHQAMSKAFRDALLLLVSALIGVAGILLWLEEGPLVWLYHGRVARHLIFVTWGLVLAAHMCAHWQQPKRWLAWLLAALALGASLFFVLPSRRATVFVTSFLLSGALLGAGTWTLRRRRGDVHWRHSWLPVALLCACLLTCAVALPGRKKELWGLEPERWDRISAFDRELNRWLAKNALPNELILPALYPPTELQQKTGHPVLMEWETPNLMTYMPRLAPPIGMMLRDLFGIDYFDPERLAHTAQNGWVRLDLAWIDTWQHRKRGEWQRLGCKYDFRLVLSPTAVPLDLPVTLAGQRWTLYTIPASPTASHGQSRCASPPNREK